MDPNLEKIRDANLSLIKRGKLRRPLFQAEDYLSWLLNEPTKVQPELEEFTHHLQTLEVNHGQGSQASEEEG